MRAVFPQKICRLIVQNSPGTEAIHAYAVAFEIPREIARQVDHCRFDGRVFDGHCHGRIRIDFETGRHHPVDGRHVDYVAPAPGAKIKAELLRDEEIPAQMEVDVFTKILVRDVFQLATVASIAWISAVHQAIDTAMPYLQSCNQSANRRLVGNIQEFGFGAL